GVLRVVPSRDPRRPSRRAPADGSVRPRGAGEGAAAVGRARECAPAWPGGAQHRPPPWLLGLWRTWRHAERRCRGGPVGPPAPRSTAGGPHAALLKAQRRRGAPALALLRGRGALRGARRAGGWGYAGRAAKRIADAAVALSDPMRAAWYYCEALSFYRRVE